MSIDTITWTPGLSLDAVERMVILKAFQFFKKNKTATAASLGISLRTLDNKLERYEMEAKLEEERQANEARKRTEFLIRQRGNPPNNEGIVYTPFTATVKEDSTQRHFPTPSGPRMESIANATPEQPLSMPKPEEVQVVLPKHVAQGNKGRTR